jgi:hypothetical protein
MKKGAFPGRHAIIVPAFLLASFAVLPLCAQPTRPSGEVPFVYFGHVFLVDPDAMSLRRVGALSLTTPAVARDPQGRIWGRLERNELAALDPATGAVAARVPLPYAAYEHVVTPSGLAVVTHAAQTKEGFTATVVDTAAGKAVREITGIAGLRTDLAAAGETVYLAVIGTGRNDGGALRLYEIDPRAGALRELLVDRSGVHGLRVAAAGGRLYAAFVARPGSGAPERIEVRDRPTARIVRTADESLWGKDRRLTGLYATGTAVFLFLETAGRAHELLVADPGLSLALRRLSLPGPVSRVLAARGNELVYLDVPFEAGYRDVNLCFYDLGLGKEVKRVNIPGYVASLNKVPAK